MLTLPRWGIALAVALVLAAGLAAPKLLQLRGTDESTAATAPEILRVTVHRVTPTRMEERLTTIGTIRADEQVEIVSEIAGKIDAIHFDEGSRVEKGQLLLEIDDSELAAEWERAIHRVELAERAEARQQQLLDDGVISSETYDVALGELNVLSSELRLIEAQLAKTEIRAPFAGVIGLRWVSPGSYLSPQTRIASLQALDPVKIEFSVPERYAGMMRVGAGIRFTVEGIDREFDGTIYAIEPGVDPSTRSLRMRATSPNPDGLLYPGTFANIELAVRTVTDALAVPAIAVIPELGGKKVFVAVDGRAEPRSVTTGIRTERSVQITGGLEPGDLVITSAILQLQPGLAVEIEGEPAEPGDDA